MQNRAHYVGEQGSVSQFPAAQGAGEQGAGEQGAGAQGPVSSLPVNWCGYPIECLGRFYGQSLLTACSSFMRYYWLAESGQPMILDANNRFVPYNHFIPQQVVYAKLPHQFFSGQHASMSSVPMPHPGAMVSPVPAPASVLPTSVSSVPVSPVPMSPAPVSPALAMMSPVPMLPVSMSPGRMSPVPAPAPALVSPTPGSVSPVPAPALVSPTPRSVSQVPGSVSPVPASPTPMSPANVGAYFTVVSSSASYVKPAGPGEDESLDPPVLGPRRGSKPSDVKIIHDILSDVNILTRYKVNMSKVDHQAFNEIDIRHDYVLNNDESILKSLADLLTRMIYDGFKLFCVPREVAVEKGSIYATCSNHREIDSLSALAILNALRDLTEQEMKDLKDICCSEELEKKFCSVLGSGLIEAEMKNGIGCQEAYDRAINQSAKRSSISRNINDALSKDSERVYLVVGDNVVNFFKTEPKAINILKGILDSILTNDPTYRLTGNVDNTNPGNYTGMFADHIKIRGGEVVSVGSCRSDEELYSANCEHELLSLAPYFGA